MVADQVEDTTAAVRMSSRPRPARRFNASVLLANYGVVAFLLVLVAGFSISLPDTFPTWGNARSVLADQSIPGILALAAVLPLAAGEFDLSLGASLGFCAIVATWAANAGLPLALVVLVTVLIGLAVGAVNALLVVRVGVNAFIATLGVATVLAGGNLFVTDSSLLTLESEAFANLTITRVGGVQVVLFYFIALSLLVWYVMDRTPSGRYLRATGMGRSAARLSGVRTDRYLTGAFLAAGALAGLAGALQASRAGSATPSLGPDFLLPAYAAAFLGATTIKPGYFNTWGTVAGVFLLAVGSNGLTLLGAQTWVTNIFNGTALIVAVSASVLVARNRNQRRAA